jgi:beta-glucosidase
MVTKWYSCTFPIPALPMDLSRTLQGFKRINLKAGETKTVTFELTPENLAVYHPDHKMYVPEGTISISVGGSQPNPTAIANATVVTAQADINGEFTEVW